MKTHNVIAHTRGAITATLRWAAFWFLFACSIATFVATFLGGGVLALMASVLLLAVAGVVVPGAPKWRDDV